MVRAQLALLPVVIVMDMIAGQDRIWRWDADLWIWTVGYVLGLLAFPIGARLHKPKPLKWWLRIDFTLSVILAVPFILITTLLKHYPIAENDDYMLYYKKSIMSCPVVLLGKKAGPFIEKTSLSLYHSFHDAGIAQTDFNVELSTGSCYGINHDKTSGHSWCCPIDSATYHANTDRITHIIDSIWESQLASFPSGYGQFIFPDDFSEMEYAYKKSHTIITILITPHITTITTA